MDNLDLMQELLETVRPHRVLVPNGNIPMKSKEVVKQVVFDHSTQTTMKKMRDKVAYAIERELGRKPTKKEVNRGFATWKSLRIATNQSDGVERVAVIDKVSYIITPTDKPKNVPEISENQVRIEVMKTVRGEKK
jgi:hypothetical protein